MDSLVAYDVIRTTTDKLQDMLNGYSEGWEVEQITHLGGRDWVIIATREFDSPGERQRYLDEL